MVSDDDVVIDRIMVQNGDGEERVRRREGGLFLFFFSRNLPCVYRSDRNRLISGSFCWFLFG